MAQTLPLPLHLASPHFVSLEILSRPSIWTVATQLEIRKRTSGCTSSPEPLEATVLRAEAPANAA